MMAAAALLVALCCLQGCMAITIGGITVPVLGFRGTEVNMNCGFQTDGAEEDGAITVTWYKDDVPFFSSTFQGLNAEKSTLNDVPGIQVDESDSGFRGLTLSSAKVNTGGAYHCVAASSKNTATSEKKTLLVIAQPTTDPVITGVHESVWVPNGTLQINCTAPKSYPASNITWFVEGKPAEKQRLIPWPTEVDEEGLETSRLGLNLQLGPDPLNEEIDVTCQAVVNKTVIHLGETMATRDDLFYKRTLDLTVRSGASQTTASLLLLLLPLLTMCVYPLPDAALAA